METDIDLLNTMGKFIAHSSVKSEIVVLLHHQSGVYVSCRKLYGSNTTV